VIVLSILYGLGAALSWGAGDFTGGMAARKAGAYRAVFYAEIFGILILLIPLTLVDESFPGTKTFLLCMLAGALGSIGLLLLYHSMTLGLMSIAAPVSALLAAMIPVIVGIVTEGWPEYLTILGFVFALFAVWMVSQGENGVTDLFAHLSDLKLPLFAGIGFGLYFVVLHQATQESGVVWPMLASRIGGLILVLTYLLIARISWKVDPSAWPMICVNGTLDIAGNFFFIMAGQSGRLDVTAVLSGLFPGATVLLAWIFLRERLTRNQWIGIASALTAIVLMTL
jgi:drug/metabolite transporter (DMT)-like permease